MEESAPLKKRFDLSSYSIVVGFLCLEVLAFISFYLGHSYILYGSLSIALAILLGLVTFRQINKDGIASFAFFLFPLFVFGLLTALSNFNYSSIGAIGTAESVFVPLSLTFISISGFLTSYVKWFKLKNAMIVIYGALAIFVFINLLITMIYYVPFYTLIYKNSYIFYNGKPSPLPIGQMAYMLFGFQVSEVTLEYWTLFPSLLLTSVVPLFFIKPKENKREFILYAVFAGLAFISLLFTISKYTLITDLILVIGIGVIILAAKVHKSRNILNTMMITIGIIILIVLILMFVIAQTSWGFTSGLRNAISSNALLNRLFISNRYSSGILVIFQDLFSSFKIFGVPVGGEAYLYPNGVSQVMSNIWLFDNLLSSGLFGAIFFLIAIVIGIIKLFKYLKNDPEQDYLKYLLATYVLGFLVISLFLGDTTPLVNSDRLFPFFTNAPLLIVIFLLSYVFNKTLDYKKVETIKQEVEVKEEDDNETIKI